MRKFYKLIRAFEIKESMPMPNDVLYGKTLRKSYARTPEIMDMPNLLEIQKSSYKWFLNTG